MTIRLLIDGYNLLHATGAVAGGGGPAGLVRARDRLLSQIAGYFNDAERSEVQVVFDAGRSRRDQPELIVRGITVTYAVGYPEADDLLEEIIRQHPNPRRLTVVSSDLRVQRCAKSRRASAIGCDAWLMQMLDDRPRDADRTGKPESATKEPIVDEKLSAEEVKRWLDEFGL